MDLKDIYRPISRELNAVEQVLKASLKNGSNKSMLEVVSHILASPGKRIRPALVILSARASHNGFSDKLAKIAAAVELIHIASLVHDDIIDHASLRHNKPTINSKWGQDVAIALGDYLYSEAFRLVAECENVDIVSCISLATKTMCEGELLQVCERDNLDLLKAHYIITVKKKTAGLFVASCKAGAMLVGSNRIIHSALEEYALNFGIAFQIVDDCLDLIADEKDLGKAPGADFKVGELTLPVLNLILKSKDRKKIISLLKQPDRQDAFKDLRQEFINSEALLKTEEDISSYARKAKAPLSKLGESCFKQSLYFLADYIIIERTRKLLCNRTLSLKA